MKKTKSTRRTRPADSGAKPTKGKNIPAAKKNAAKRGETANKAVTNAKGKAKKEQPGATSEGRHGSKKMAVLALLERKEGTTMAQMMKATGWQKHSVRGFLSGALGKKMGLKIVSAKGDGGERVYRLNR